MKGMIKQGIIILASVIIMLLILSISYDWVVKAAKPEWWEHAWELGEGKTGDPTQPSGDFPSPYNNIDDIEVKHIVTNEGDEHQPHEVACKIAYDIYTDYRANGNQDDARDNCYIEGQCLVGYGSFTLDDTEIGSDWENKLSTSTYGPCHVCQEGGSPIVNLDEVCINLNLRDRKISGSLWFCDDEMTVGGEYAEFGNRECEDGNFGNSAAWREHCDGDDNEGWDTSGPIISNSAHDFCDNGYNRLEWWPDSDGNIANTDPIWKVRDNSYYEDDEPIAKHRKYIYGLWWREETSVISESEKRYDLVLSRVPEDGTQTDFSFISDIFRDKWERYNKNGYFSQEARQVASVIVDYDCTPGINCKNELELRKEIAEAAGFERDELIVDRNCDNNCLITSVRGTDVCTSRGVISPNPTNSDIRGNYFHKEPIYLKLPINEMGDIQPGKYKVIVTNWYGYYFEKAPPLGWPYDCYDGVDRTVGIYKIGDEENCLATCQNLGYDTRACGDTGCQDYFCYGGCNYNVADQGTGPWTDCSSDVTGTYCCCYYREDCPDCTSNCGPTGCAAPENCLATCQNLGYDTRACGDTGCQDYFCYGKACFYNMANQGTGPWTDCSQYCCCYDGVDCADAADCTSNCGPYGCSG